MKRLTFKPKTIDPAATLKRLETYLLYEREKQLSPRNVHSVVCVARRIFTVYQPTTINQDLANTIQQDLRSKNRASSTIRWYLFTLEYLAESQGQTVHFSKPQANSHEVDYLTEDEVRLMITTALEDPILGGRDSAIISILATTGLRNTELCQLELADVDLQNNRLFVRDHGMGIKKKRERRAYMTTKCKGLLEAYLKTRPRIDSKALFLTRDGSQYSSRALRWMVRAVARRAGIQRRVYPHLLRHTFGTNARLNDMDDTLVGRQLGHRSNVVTRMYQHATEEALRQQIDRKIRY